MEKQHILDEIKRIANANGGVAPGKKKFLQETGIRENDWKGIFWVNWSDAVSEAGLKPNTMNEALDDDVLLNRAAEFVRELGHFPQRAELNLKRRQDDSFPSEKTFRQHFGNKGPFALAVLQWCQEENGWGDVVELCKPHAKADRPKSKEPKPDTAGDGFVYLMKSGKHYKIGFTNSIDRRRYELGPKLPLGIEPIHTIRTDDPAGIEAYWHRRFKDKHLNGEWFDLAPKDVAAFKRRKFM